MPTVTRAYSEVDGAVAEASSVNRVIDDLYTSINALDFDNLKNSGVIASSIGDTAILARHLNESSVGPTAIQNSGVLASHIAAGAVTFGAISHEVIIFSQEIF